MKLDKKILLLLGVITVGLLFSLGANAYLLKEVTDIRIILDSQFEVISNIMMMLGFELKTLPLIQEGTYDIFKSKRNIKKQVLDHLR